MKLSQYFTLEELTVSQTAARRGIDNIPSPDALVNLGILAKTLDEIRALMLRPVLISSAYRSPTLNSVIGSSMKSDHPKGLAADFTCPAYGNVLEVFTRIKNSHVNFDQLILEHPERNGWVHIGMGERMRRQCLTFDGKSYKEIK